MDMTARFARWEERIFFRSITWIPIANLRPDSSATLAMPCLRNVVALFSLSYFNSHTNQHRSLYEGSHIDFTLHHSVILLTNRRSEISTSRNKKFGTSTNSRTAKRLNFKILDIAQNEPTKTLRT